MTIARVIGNAEDSFQQDSTLLKVQPLNGRLESCGSTIWAIDTIGALPNEVVLLERNKNSPHFYIVGRTCSVETLAREQTPVKKQDV